MSYLDDRNDAFNDLDSVSMRSQANENESQAKTSAAQSNYLTMYFREMAALDVLRPDEEHTAAREIETREIRVWTELLDYAPLAERVLAIVADVMEKVPTEVRSLERLNAEARQRAAEGPRAKSFRQKLERATRKCAEKIHGSDTDKIYLDAVLARLQESLSPAAQPTATEPPPGAADQALVTQMQRVYVAERAAREARNDFVKANLRLVVSIARRFNHGRMALADLIQEGNLGLIKAVERYDYRRGFRFSTYASWWIRHAIGRALADKGREVRLPVHMLDAHQRLSKAQRLLASELGRQPTDEELAAATDMPPEKIEKMRSHLFDQALSLDRPVNDEDGRPLVELILDPEGEESSTADVLNHRALTAEVRRALEDLRPIEADILRRRFGLDDDEELTLKQIGEKYNLSRERIRQLQEQALTKMREALSLREMM